MTAPDPCDFAALLAPAVKAYQKRHGVTQEALAELAGIDAGNLSRALRNPNARPETVRAVCKVLGMRVKLVKEDRG